MEDILKNESNGPEESPEWHPGNWRTRNFGRARNGGEDRKSEDEVVHHPRLLGL